MRFFLVEDGDYETPIELDAVRFDDACEEAISRGGLTLLYDESEGDWCTRLSALAHTLAENDMEVLSASEIEKNRG